MKQLYFKWVWAWNKARSAVCTEFATSWRIWTNLQKAKSSCVVSALWTHPSAVVTQFTSSCAVKLLRLVTSDDIMTSLFKKLSMSIKNSRNQTAMESVWSVSKLSTESGGSRRELVANSVHTADADADATRLDSWVVSAVCIGHKSGMQHRRFVY